MFVDKVKIRVKAGDGGNGCVSFRREKYIDRGGPDGGSGGKGGDIVLVADKNASDLSDFYFQPRVVARHGVHGRGKNCVGRSAKTILVNVPIGTQVFRLTAPIKQRAPSNYHPAAATEEFDPRVTVGIPFTPGRAKQLAQAQRDKDLIVKSPTEPLVIDQEEVPVLDTGRELIADLVEDGQKFVLAKGGRGGRGNAVFKSS